MDQKRHFIPIWFFIGVLLAIYGVLIFGAGIYDWIYPAKTEVVMGQLHAGIWWGALLIAIGGFYTVRFYPGRR